MERVRGQNETRDSETNPRLCPECDSTDILPDENNDLVCRDCGLVIREAPVELDAEWRAFSAEERNRKSRVGAPVSVRLHDKGLTTEISWGDYDANGNPVAGKQRHKLQRLRTWHQRLRADSGFERNLQFALGEIDRMGSALGLPKSTRETASVVYRRAWEDDLIRGHSIEALATSAILVACRQADIPRTLERVSGVSKVDRNEVANKFRYLCRELDIAVEPVHPSDYISRFCSDLDVSGTVERQATTIVRRISEKGFLSGRSPNGVAAAAIYGASLLCDEPRTQTEIADVADTTDVTIRNQFREQMELLGVDLTYDRSERQLLPPAGLTRIDEHAGDPSA